jgi:hypothetical protein
LSLARLPRECRILGASGSLLARPTRGPDTARPSVEEPPHRASESGTAAIATLALGVHRCRALSGNHQCRTCLGGHRRRVPRRSWVMACRHRSRMAVRRRLPRERCCRLPACLESVAAWEPQCHHRPCAPRPRRRSPFDWELPPPRLRI